MTTLREAFRPFTKIFIGTVIVVLPSFFFYHSLPLHFHSCAHGSSWPEHYLDGSVYNYSKELRQFCSDLIVFGHVIETPIISLLHTFAVLAFFCALKRWLSKLWHNTGAILPSINLPSSHAVLFILALFRTFFRLVVGITTSFIAAFLAYGVTQNVVDSLETKAEKWIHFHFHPIFPCLYFSLSYCVVTFLVDNALARVELCHTLATKLDSLQEMKLCKNDAGSDKDENGEAKKKSIFYI